MPAPLGARAFDLLMTLAERPGELVSKNELLDRVWPGMVVEEGNIAVQVNALRKVLGGELIATVPGRGYCFTGRVEGTISSALATLAFGGGLQTLLPRILPELFGRANDLAALESLVESHTLVSVIGAGGIGKTLLVQHLLAKRRPLHAHGVCWVELAEVADEAALPATLAAALGVRLGSGDTVDALAVAIGPLDLLLALDNAEHLTTAVGTLAAALLHAAPALKLVVTSQTRLGLATERTLRLPTLELPPEGASLQQATAAGATALFVDRAHASDARFVLTEENVAAIVSVCRSLDGLPLAIELAAARASTLGVHHLATAMGDRLQLLTRNRHRSAPARQQTLRATLVWSHGFLDATEQTVFRRLAVVAGSCSLTMAQVVASDAPGEGHIDIWAVLDALDGLVDRSLVAVLAGDDDANPRYRLLESTKAFAMEKLVASGEAETTRLRLAQAVERLFEQAWETYMSGSTTSGRLRQMLAQDCDNARAAIGWMGCPSSMRLRISAHLQFALPSALVHERLSLADACDALLDTEPLLQLRMLGLLSVAVTWANTRRRRGLVAVKRAVTFAREHARLTGDSAYLSHALGLMAFAMAIDHDVGAVNQALLEMKALEEAGTVPTHLLWRADAEMIVASLRGDHAERLRLARQKLAASWNSQDELLMGMSNLVDAELAAGNAHAAAETGRALVARHEAGRDEYHLNWARLNLCAALLALDAIQEARRIAEAGWGQAKRYELQGCWADYIALLAALESRPVVAAQLCGFSVAAYSTADELREVNEAAAFDRACGIAIAALGERRFELLHIEGQSLAYDDISTIAFGMQK